MPEFPLSMMPEPVQNLAQEVSVSMSVPVDLVAVACLGAMTSCTSGRFVVDIDGDWTVGASAYLLVLRGSGGKKSPTMKLVYGPLRAAQADLWTQWQETDKESRGPSPRVLMRGNATGEGLGLHWAATGGKAHICDSEGAWWSILAGRYSANPTWDEILSGWDGDVYEVTRAGRPSFVVEQAWLSLCTLVQPAAVVDLVEQPKARDLGIIGRLLACQPGDVAVDVRAAATSGETMERWARWITGCAYTYWAFRAPERIGMTPDAREVLYGIEEQYITEAAPGGPLHRFEAWAKKAAGHAVSLAAIVSRCDRLDKGYVAPLSAEDMATGASLMEYFAAMLPTSFPAAEPPGLVDARKITEWVGRQDGEWTRREVWHAHRDAFGTANEVVPAVDFLADLGAIKAGERDSWRTVDVTSLPT